MRSNALMGLGAAPSVELCRSTLLTVNSTAVEDFGVLVDSMLMVNAPCRAVAWSLALAQAQFLLQAKGCR